MKEDHINIQVPLEKCCVVFIIFEIKCWAFCPENRSHFRLCVLFPSVTKYILVRLRTAPSQEGKGRDPASVRRFWTGYPPQTVKIGRFFELQYIFKAVGKGSEKQRI